MSPGVTSNGVAFDVGASDCYASSQPLQRRGALAVVDEEEQALAILLILGKSFAAPRQFSFDFQLKRHTQKRAD